MTDIRNIKPVSGGVERRDSLVSINLQFATEADAQAAYAAMARAVREGSLNIIAGLPPVANANTESQG